MKFRKQNDIEGAAKAQRVVRPVKPAKSPKSQARRRTSGSAEKKKPRGKQKFVLLIGDEGGILVYMQGKKVVRRLFAASPQPDHTGAILELLGSHPNVPLSVLVDVMDQQYARHSFPPVSALSVAGLVKRRIERDFQPGDITGSMRLGRDKTGRKEWQYLLISLGYTPLVQQWLDLIVEQPNELRGIFLSPVEGQSYLPMLRSTLSSSKPLVWQLLVSHHKVSGFRQIVLKNGKLAFTRITQAIDDAVPAVIAGNIEQEIMNTLEYLKRLGFDDTHALEIIVVASGDVNEVLDLKRFNIGQYWALSPMEVAENLGLEQAALSADRFGDVVMASAFAHAKRTHLRLMTAYATKLSQLYMARIGLRIAAVLVAITLFCMSGMRMLEAFDANSAAADSDAKRRPVEQQITTLRQALNGLSKDIAFKSAVTLTYDAYMKDLTAPTDFIDVIQGYLPAEVRVRKFTWGKPTEAAEQNAAAAVPAAPGMPGAATANLPQATLVLEINGDFSNTESLAHYTKLFVDRLKQGLPQYEITNDPYPWEKEAPKSVEISFDQLMQETAIKEGENQITLTFRGPKPVANATPQGAMP